MTANHDSDSLTPIAAAVHIYVPVAMEQNSIVGRLSIAMWLASAWKQKRWAFGLIQQYAAFCLHGSIYTLL